MKTHSAIADSKLAINGAIGANVAIAATKFTVAGIACPSALLSEGVHAEVDPLNGLLFLVLRLPLQVALLALTAWRTFSKSAG